MSDHKTPQAAKTEVAQVAPKEDVKMDSMQTVLKDVKAEDWLKAILKEYADLIVQARAAKYPSPLLQKRSTLKDMAHKAAAYAGTVLDRKLWDAYDVEMGWTNGRAQRQAK